MELFAWKTLKGWKNQWLHHTYYLLSFLGLSTSDHAKLANLFLKLLTLKFLIILMLVARCLLLLLIAPLRSTFRLNCDQTIMSRCNTPEIAQTDRHRNKYKYLSYYSRISLRPSQGSQVRLHAGYSRIRYVNTQLYLF